MAAVSQHTLRVMRLYRAALKNSLDTIVLRPLWREEALAIRDRFEKNRNVTDPRAAGMIVEAGEKELFEILHPQPYIHPADPGGSTYERNIPPPLPEQLYKRDDTAAPLYPWNEEEIYNLLHIDSNEFFRRTDWVKEREMWCSQVNARLADVGWRAHWENFALMREYYGTPEQNAASQAKFVKEAEEMYPSCKGMLSGDWTVPDKSQYKVVIAGVADEVSRLGTTKAAREIGHEVLERLVAAAQNDGVKVTQKDLLELSSAEAQKHAQSVSEMEKMFPSTQGRLNPSWTPKSREAFLNAVSQVYTEIKTKAKTPEQNAIGRKAIVGMMDRAVSLGLDVSHTDLPDIVAQSSPPH